MVTTTYGDGEMAEGREECWTVILTMVIVIWRELRKLRVEAEKYYWSGTTSVMAGQYLWETFQAHIVIYNFLRSQFRQQPEVAPHIILYLFEHREPQVKL